MNNIEKYGYDNFYEAQIEQLKINDTNLIPARVIEVQKEQYKIISNNGENRARLKGSIFYDNKSVLYPTVGDFVLIKPNPLGDDTIYYVLERKSKFSRLDSFNFIEQMVAANFDYVFILTSLNYDFNIKRIERYLTAAWQSGAMPVIVLTKSDLCEDYEEQKNKLEVIAPGVPVMAISSMNGDGINELKEYVKPYKTVVFLGSSGVGKSSLVNALFGEEKMVVSAIREDDSKGHHTTTYRELFMLPNDAIIIDTPGMRELGMWAVSDGLDTAFAEIEDLAKRCKFNDCSHQSEPGCAVKAALESGELTEERWKNYLKLRKEAAFAQQKETIAARLRDKARDRSLSKFQKEFKKGGI
jgi:ribosome biogenesis GTPase